MAGEMGENMAGASKEQMAEDVAMLRQIMDNLIAFSFSQEVHATPKNINAPALNNLNIIFIALSFNY